MAIRWTPALAVGVPAIDEQHRELFLRVDRLVQAMLASDTAEVARLMDFLGAYVVEHFRMEEALMRRHLYPGSALHKAAHDRFLKDFGDLRARLEIRGAVSFVTIQLKTWLCEWLVAHVSGTDLALARHLNRPTGAPQARAS